MKVNLSILKIFVLVFSFYQTICFAQTARKPDVIVLKTNTKLEVIIQEVLVDMIKYKKLSDSDGPLFSLDKKEIASILYGNGEVETFNQTQQDIINSDRSSLHAIESSSKSSIPKNKFEESLINASPGRLRTTYNHYHIKSKNGLAIGIAGVTVGTIVAGIGAAMIINATDSNGNRSYQHDLRARDGALIIIGGLAGGIAFGTMGFVKAGKNGSKSTRIKRELERRGESLIFNFRPVINPSSQLAGLSLKMSF